LLAESRERPYRGGGGRIDPARLADVCEHLRHQCLIDLRAGEVGVALGFVYRLQVVGGIGQRDAGATATEVQESDDPTARQAGAGSKGGQRSRGVGYELGRDAAGRQLAVRA
jgi:hypothetical protein